MGIKTFPSKSKMTKFFSSITCCALCAWHKKIVRVRICFEKNFGTLKPKPTTSKPVLGTIHGSGA
jgi:hypothetical protein